MGHGSDLDAISMGEDQSRPFQESWYRVSGIARVSIGLGHGSDLDGGADQSMPLQERASPVNERPSVLPSAL